MERCRLRKIIFWVGEEARVEKPNGHGAGWRRTAVCELDPDSSFTGRHVLWHVCVHLPRRDRKDGHCASIDEDRNTSELRRCWECRGNRNAVRTEVAAVYSERQLNTGSEVPDANGSGIVGDYQPAGIRTEGRPDPLSMMPQRRSNGVAGFAIPELYAACPDAILADRWVVCGRLLKVRCGGLAAAIGMRYMNLPFLGVRHERTVAGKRRRINIDVTCNRGPEADIAAHRPQIVRRLTDLGWPTANERDP